MQKLKLIIFDVDGTLADTEQYGHLPACNDAMKSIGLNVVWKWEDFKAMLNIPGTSNRLRVELKKRNYDENEIEEYVKKFEPLKKELYIKKYLAKLNLREGIKDLINETIKNKIKLAIVSTSHESQIKALLDLKLPEQQHYFEIILGKESGKKTNNNGYLHKKCLELTKCSPEESLAIEDSEEGLQAAVSAGIPTAVFYNDYTYGSPFVKAKLVAHSLKLFNLKLLTELTVMKNFRSP